MENKNLYDLTIKIITVVLNEIELEDNLSKDMEGLLVDLLANRGYPNGRNFVIKNLNSYINKRLVLENTILNREQLNFPQSWKFYERIK